MQAVYLKKHSKGSEASFTIRHAVVPYMYDVWHYHEELELNLVLKGSGTRFIGDSVENFENDDLVLVGSNLPHVWKNSSSHYDLSPGVEAEAILIQFLPMFLGTDFLNLPEMAPVMKVLESAKRGLLISGETRKTVGEKMKKMLKSNETEKLILLLDILRIIAFSTEVKELVSQGFLTFYKSANVDKINKVYNYIIANLTGKISLEEASGLVNMNVSAFCRYFKATTKKTFIDFVNEIRIGYACKLLIENKHNVTETCFKSGFNNLSYFNRQFKSAMGVTPKDYRKSYLENL